MDSPADLLTTTQAAAILGVDASRVRQLVAAGRLPAIKPGYDWLITRADVEAARAPAGTGNGSDATQKASEKGSHPLDRLTQTISLLV